MTLTDALLTNPAARAVHAAIEAAFQVVNGHSPAVHIPHTKISVKRVAEAATASEGVEFWVSHSVAPFTMAGQVLVAWWTATSGRRFVRVVGRVLTAATSYLANGVKLGTRPPLWHVFPDRVYRRRAGRANDIVCVCGCGAVGTEAALGWAGPCCGPCADYRDEHGAIPWTAPALFPISTPCFAVAASADGRFVAGVRAGGRSVSVWDTTAGTDPLFVWSAPYTDANVSDVALSADGRFLALPGQSDGQLVWVDLFASPPRASTQAADASGLAFRPLGELYIATGGSVQVVAQPGARATGAGLNVTDATGPLAFDRAGARVAVACDGHVRVFETSGAALATVPRPHPSNIRIGVPDRRAGARVALSPDGAQVAVGFGRALAVYHAVTGAQRFLDNDLDDEVSGVAFDPGGKWLYVSRFDGTLAAYHTATFAPERTVILRWSLGPIHALALCGADLVTACDEGAKVWPVEKLLEGL